MTYSADRSTDLEGPAGYTYAAILVRVADEHQARDRVVAALRKLRFSGWVAPPRDGWLVAVPVSGVGTVAAARRSAVGVGAALASTAAETVLAVRVLRDRQLVLVAWTGGTEVGRYVSDPSREPGADDEVLPDPVGVEAAEEIATACGRPEAGEELAELLSEELDEDSEIESERLGRVLRLLELPTWVVAASALPKDVPTGPRTRDLTRLGAGVPGPLGFLAGRAADVVRRHRPPEPVLTELPRMDPGMDDPWLS